MENKSNEDKEIQDIIDDITSTAKELVDEYVSGSDNFVPEEERTKLNEKEIKAPYKDDELVDPFKVTDEEMDILISNQNQIKEVLLDNPSIYIKGERDIVDIFNYAKEVGGDKFSILEYIGTDKQRLRECLTIKIKIESQK